MDKMRDGERRKKIERGRVDSVRENFIKNRPKLIELGKERQRKGRGNFLYMGGLAFYGMAHFISPETKTHWTEEYSRL